MTNDARKTKAELIEELAHLRKMVRQDPARHLFDSAPLPYQSPGRAGAAGGSQPGLARYDGLPGGRGPRAVGVGEFMTQASRDFTARNYPVFLEHGEARELEFTYIKRDGTRIEVSLDRQAGAGSRRPPGPTPSCTTSRKSFGPGRTWRTASGGSGVSLNPMPTASSTRTPPGPCLNVNPALCLMLGYGEDELLGKHVLDIMPEEEGETERACLVPAARFSRTGVASIFRRSSSMRTAVSCRFRSGPGPTWTRPALPRECGRLSGT